MNLEQKRLALNKELEKTPGCSKVYYTPPTGMEMEYPCIAYELAGSQRRFADNIPYFVKLQWTVTVIDEDPDSQLANIFMNKANCSFVTKYSVSDLNHFVFKMNY